MPLCAKLLTTLKDEQSHHRGGDRYHMGYIKFIEIGVERQKKGMKLKGGENDVKIIVKTKQK